MWSLAAVEVETLSANHSNQGVDSIVTIFMRDVCYDSAIILVDVYLPLIGIFIPSKHGISVPNYTA